MEETTTALAREETGHLRRTLGRFDIVFLVISAVVGLEVLAQTASFGAETFTWTLFLALAFLLPYGLIFAETGSTFIGEGGAYLWVRRAFGRPLAALASILSWVTQPVWVGGTMSFLAAEAWSRYVMHLSTGSLTDYVFKLVFIWVSVLAAVVSLAKAKWLPSLGGVLKVAFLAFFLLTAVLYAAKNGLGTIGAHDFAPTLPGFIGLVPLLLFAYLGFDAASSASGEMKNPSRDIPVSILRSGITAAICYALPILAMLLVLPEDKITGVGGLMDAVGLVFSVYGPAQGVMTHVAGFLFVLILAAQGASWLIMSDRMQALAAADGAFFGGFFGRFDRRLGTPVNVNLLSGAVATVFMLAAMQLKGTSAAMFAVVLNISVSTFLLSYLIIIPAVVRLRRAHGEDPRPFRVPGGNGVFTALGVLCFAWVLLGAWTTVLPGTLEPLLGVDYDFADTWGVGRGSFELLTWGTLAVLAALAAVGYVRGARVRRHSVAADSDELTDVPEDLPAVPGH